jgi:hypothetical protein
MTRLVDERSTELGEHEEKHGPEEQMSAGARGL